MIQFTYSDTRGNSLHAYLQRIVLGQSYPLPSEPELNFMSTKTFVVLDKERTQAEGELQYTTTARGGMVTYQTMGVHESLYQFKEGDELLLVKKNLNDEKGYLFTSRGMFEEYFGVAVPSLMCSVVYLNDRGNESFHLFVEDERVMTLIGQSTYKPNVKAMKRYCKEILEKLHEVFVSLDIPKVIFSYPEEGINALFPVLQNNFYIHQNTNGETVELMELPSVTCPFIRWVIREGKSYFSLVELEGIETPIKGVRHFKGNQLYFEQLVRWYYTLALME